MKMAVNFSKALKNLHGLNFIKTLGFIRTKYKPRQRLWKDIFFYKSSTLYNRKSHLLYEVPSRAYKRRIPRKKING